MRASESKPAIIVIALGMLPDAGSEPGKGWWWASALSSAFTLHVITPNHCYLACKDQPLCVEDNWKFYPTEDKITTWRFGWGYAQYASWLKIAMRQAREIMRQAPVVGLCHVILGSFRVLPRYDLLGLPYVLGPLGGGESAPEEFLRGRPVASTHVWAERLRPRLNDLFTFVPSLRRCMESAALVTVTSGETAQTVQKMGAKNTAVVFPDSYDCPIEADRILAANSARALDLQKEICLIWQGRPLWWKAPDLALVLIRRALDRGVRARLSMVGHWNNELGNRLRALSVELQINEQIDWVAPMPRRDLMVLMGRHHGFIATSLHDSGGIPLIEAQAQGLPCFTLGLGGNRLAACPDAGVSQDVRGKEDFFTRSVDCLTAWQENPGLWLEQSRRALDFAAQFNKTRLQRYVRELIVPAFSSQSPRT